MKKLKWSASVLKVEDLQPWEDNPRKISKEAFGKLVARIKERGFHSVIVTDTDRTILSGNQRKKALQELGIKEVTVLSPSRPLTKEEREKIALESNLNDGQWDFEKLKSFDFGTLEFAGFGKIELAQIFDKEKEVEDDRFDTERELKKIKKPRTKLGDIIRMGGHKILCGDSTDPKNLSRLLGEERAAMIYSDPVYNISYQYDSGLGGKKSKKDYGGNVNDTRTFDEYKKFLKDSMIAALAVSEKDLHVFYYCDQIYIGVVQDLYRELGIANRRVAIWLKNSQNPVPSVAFNKAYEPCVYGTLGKPYLSDLLKNLTEVMNREMRTGNNLHDDVNEFLDVWVAKRLPGKEYEHGTSKPPQLHQKAILRCTKPNDIILDSFLGSGSTIIAAEALGRRAYGCELEPLFCDLMVRRWEKLTGKKAVYEEDAETGK